MVGEFEHILHKLYKFIQAKRMDRNEREKESKVRGKRGREGDQPEHWVTGKRGEGGVLFRSSLSCKSHGQLGCSSCFYVRDGTTPLGAPPSTPLHLSPPHPPLSTSPPTCLQSLGLSTLYQARCRQAPQEMCSQPWWLWVTLLPWSLFGSGEYTRSKVRKAGKPIATRLTSGEMTILSLSSSKGWWWLNSFSVLIVSCRLSSSVVSALSCPVRFCGTHTLSSSLPPLFSPHTSRFPVVWRCCS